VVFRIWIDEKYQDSRFKILYSHKPMHYNGTEIDTNIQYQYLHAHDKMMDAWYTL
jgi:hypothetical protein